MVLCEEKIHQRTCNLAIRIRCYPMSIDCRLQLERNCY